MVEVQQEKKVAGLELAAKNMVMHKSRAELGLHPASKPTGTMADSTLYFNWRQQGKGSRSPAAKEKCEVSDHAEARTILSTFYEASLLYNFINC